MNKKRREIKPFFLLLILALSIFIIEFAVMMTLHHTVLHESLVLRYWEEALFDSTALLMFLFSILYLLVFKTLVKQEKNLKEKDKIIATYDFFSQQANKAMSFADSCLVVARSR